jgi:PA14 domain/Bacterial SH3 domain
VIRLRTLVNDSRLKYLFAILAAFCLVLILSGPAMAQTTWTASYWNNMTLSGSPTYQRGESAPPNYNWGTGSPVPGVINSDHFSAQWRADIHFDPGKYRFNVTSDDGNRLWVGGKLIINEWHDSSGITYTAEIDILETGTKPVILEYYENTGLASVTLSWERIGGNVSTTGPIRAEYFTNTDLLGQPSLVRYESVPLSNNWGTGSPAPGVIPSDNFSARYTYTIDLNPGRYRINTQAQSGMRLWVNGQLVIDQWTPAGPKDTSVDIDLPGGITHMIATYYNTTGSAYVYINAYQVGGSGGGTGGGSGGGTGGGTGAGLTATVDTSYLNMREGPGVEFAVIDVLQRGTQVVLTGQVSDYWVQVREPTGLVGWVSSSYLNFNNLNVTPSG